MSEENHPNIQAVGFTVDVIESFRKHIRGKALELFNSEGMEGKQRVLKVLTEKAIVDFVTDLSVALDKEFGT